MTNPSSNVIFTRHIHFLNFDELHMDKTMSFSNLQKPLRKRKVEYINLIRHPVDRFVSKFYHRRHGDYGSGKSIITSINSTLDINTCVNLHLSECPERLQSICLENYSNIRRIGTPTMSCTWNFNSVYHRMYWVHFVNFIVFGHCGVFMISKTYILYFFKVRSTINGRP